MFFVSSEVVGLVTFVKIIARTPESSSSALGAALFASEGRPDRGMTRERSASRAPSTRTSLGSQFRAQLSKLLETLRATSPHFIRCIKPNARKASGVIEARMVIEQLTYTGVFEAVQVYAHMT